MPIVIIFSIIAGLAFIVLLTSFICFMRVFYFKNPGPMGKDEYELPVGRIYEPYAEQMIGWMKSLREMQSQSFEIMSFDGLTLRGKYYECKKDAPIEIMFHGYQGNSERDLCGGVFRAFRLEHNVLLVDHRAGGASDGRIITFGINERRDCLGWIDLAISHFGKDCKLILTGVSMGAATVMMASAERLPANVRYVLADCGYSTAKDIIKKVIREMHLPPEILYPFVRLGGRIFGRFDLEETSPLEAVKSSNVPILFIHGNGDDFVPCDMSVELYGACGSEKELVIIEGAGHGLAYPVNKEEYLAALSEFDKKYL